MKTNSRVLIAIDLSDRDDAAIREGAALAAQTRGPLGIVHVLARPESTRDSGTKPAGLMRVKHAITQRLAVVPAARDAEIFIDEGAPHTEILKRAARWGAEVIVVGAPRPSALGRVFRGVGELVVRGATCPVLAARSAHGLGGVLAATDLTRPTLPAVVAGAEEAERRHTKLRVVHAIGFLDMEARYLLSLGRAAETGNGDFAGLDVELEDAVARLGLDPTCQVLDGSATRAIVRKAEAIDAELVVVAAQGTRGRARAVLRSVAEDVVRTAPCSVLVVRGPAAGLS